MSEYSTLLQDMKRGINSKLEAIDAIENLEADLRTSINLREQTDMQLARTQNLLGKKVAELTTIKEKARAAVNAPYEDILDMGLAQALRELKEVL